VIFASTCALSSTTCRSPKTRSNMTKDPQKLVKGQHLQIYNPFYLTERWVPLKNSNEVCPSSSFINLFHKNLPLWLLISPIFESVEKRQALNNTLNGGNKSIFKKTTIIRKPYPPSYHQGKSCVSLHCTITTSTSQAFLNRVPYLHIL
jgi:hypothetical protein